MGYCKIETAIRAISDVVDKRNKSRRPNDRVHPVAERVGSG